MIDLHLGDDEPLWPLLRPVKSRVQAPPSPPQTAMEHVENVLASPTRSPNFPKTLKAFYTLREGEIRDLLREYDLSDPPGEILLSARSNREQMMRKFALHIGVGDSSHRSVGSQWQFTTIAFSWRSCSSRMRTRQSLRLRWYPHSGDGRGSLGDYNCFIVVVFFSVGRTMGFVTMFRPCERFVRTVKPSLRSAKTQTQTLTPTQMVNIPKYAHFYHAGAH